MVDRLRAWAAAIVAAATLVSCDGLRSHLEARAVVDSLADQADGGPSWGETLRDSGADGSADDDAAADGGHAGKDAGEELPALQWTRVVAPSAQAFYGVGGLAGDGGWTLFVAADSKVLRRREGSWEVAYESKTHAPQRSLVVSSSGLVAVVGEDRVSTCADGCTQAGSLFTERVIPGARAVCADADTIYAVGTGSSLGGVVFRYARASGWSEIVSDLGARSPQGCWVGPDKALYVVARSQVLRVHQATPDSELIQFPTAWSPAQVDSEYFYGIWGTGAQVFAAGTGRKILSRTPSSTWEFVNGTDAGAGGIFYGLVGYDDRETYALGVGLARRTAPSPQWTALAFEGGTLRAGWAAGPDEFYVVGDDGTSGTLFRGAR